MEIDSESGEPVVIHFVKSYKKQFRGLKSVGNPDFEIKINNEILKVHKTTLEGKNEAFKVMLNNRPVESKDNPLEITDCDPTAFKAFLAYLYTSKVRPEHISLDLLMIAEKFVDLPLKKLCLEKLCGEISVETIVEAAKVATQCNVEELKTACQKYFIQNYKQLIGTPQLEAILEDKALLVGIVKDYDAIVKNYSKLSASPKKHKFLLDGVNILLETCDRCGCQKGDPFNDECNKCSSEDLRLPMITFYAEDVQWSMEVAIDEGENIGIYLTADNKDVRADVQLTVLSNNPAVPNITVEIKNKYFGTNFLRVYSRDRLMKSKAAKAAYVKRGTFFDVELSFNILSAKPCLHKFDSARGHVFCPQVVFGSKKEKDEEESKEEKEELEDEEEEL